MRTALASISLALLIATAAYAQPYDLAAGGILPPGCCFGVPIFVSAVEFSGIDTTTDNSDILGVAAGGHGRVLAVSDTGSIFIIRPDYSRILLYNSPTVFFAFHLVADRNGNMYVFTIGSNPRLLAIRPDGTLRYSIPFAGEGGDLAADQCTLVYAQTTTLLQRFDVCNGTPLTDPLPIAQQFQALRILPDGGVLVATGQSTLLRYDANGTLTRTYTLPPFFYPTALALGEHGATALVSNETTDVGSTVLEINLNSGAVVRETQLNILARSLVAYRGWTAAIGALASSDIPSVSTWGLLALTLLLIGTAVRRLT